MCKPSERCACGEMEYGGCMGFESPGTYFWHNYEECGKSKHTYWPADALWAIARLFQWLGSKVPKRKEPVKTILGRRP